MSGTILRLPASPVYEVENARSHQDRKKEKEVPIRMHAIVMVERNHQDQCDTDRDEEVAGQAHGLCLPLIYDQHQHQSDHDDCTVCRVVALRIHPVTDDYGSQQTKAYPFSSAHARMVRAAVGRASDGRCVPCHTEV